MSSSPEAEVSSDAALGRSSESLGASAKAGARLLSTRQEVVNYTVHQLLTLLV
jgi:hypothetical protein